VPIGHRNGGAGFPRRFSVSLARQGALTDSARWTNCSANRQDLTWLHAKDSGSNHFSNSVPPTGQRVA